MCLILRCPAEVEPLNEYGALNLIAAEMACRTTRMRSSTARGIFELSQHVARSVCVPVFVRIAGAAVILFALAVGGPNVAVDVRGARNWMTRWISIYLAASREGNVIYKILKEAGLDKLEKRVNEAIAEGWEPMGGLATVLAMPGTPIYMQALVKKKG